MSENTPKRRGRPPKQKSELEVLHRRNLAPGLRKQIDAIAAVDPAFKPKLGYAQMTREEIDKNPPSAPPPDVLEEYIRGAGRPPKYRNAAEMQEIIIRYFQDNLAEVFDENGDKVGYKWRNRISLGDLALYLGMYAQDLWAYSQKNEFSAVIKSAKNVIENYYEKALQENRNPAGICFILKNGFSWKDVQEMRVEPVNAMGDVQDRELIAKRLLGVDEIEIEDAPTIAEADVDPNDFVS